jgi:hypothetical protein
MKTYTSLKTIRLCVLIVTMLGLNACRGWTSEDPPVHLNWNMDTQEKGKAYRDSDFFADVEACVRHLQELSLKEIYR